MAVLNYYIMLKYLQVSFDNNLLLTRMSQHVQFNIYEHIKRIKYITFDRINIEFNCLEELKENFEIVGIEDKICNIRCSILIDQSNFTEELTKKVFDVLKKLFFLKKWEEFDLDRAFKNIKSKKFKTIVPYMGMKWSDNKFYAAEVKIYYKVDLAEFVIECRNKQKEILCKKTIIKARLNPMLFRRFLNHGYWENDKYVIKDELNEIRFVLDVQSCKLIHEFTPKENTLKELKAFLLAIDYKTDEHESNRLFGLPDTI